MNADGTGPRQLVSDAPGYRDHQPSYAPDGRHIVFSRCSPGDDQCAIWIMRSDGTRRHLVVPFIEAPNETNNFDPKISPDGRRDQLRPVRVQRDHLAGLGGRRQRQTSAPADRAEAGGSWPQLVTRWQPHRVHHQFRPAAVQHLCHAGKRHRSHEARHIQVADQQLRIPRTRLAAVRSRSKPPRAPGPVLRGTLRDASRRLAAAPGRHRHSRRPRRCLGVSAPGPGGIAGHALATCGWRACARRLSPRGRCRAVLARLASMRCSASAARMMLGLTQAMTAAT